MVKDDTYCDDIKQHVSDLSTEHRIEARDAVRQLEEASRTVPSKVENALEGVMSGLQATAD